MYCAYMKNAPLTSYKALKKGKTCKKCQSPTLTFCHSKTMIGKNLKKFRVTHGMVTKPFRQFRKKKKFLAGDLSENCPYICAKFQDDQLIFNILDISKRASRAVILAKLRATFVFVTQQPITPTNQITNKTASQQIHHFFKIGQLYKKYKTQVIYAYNNYKFWHLFLNVKRSM